MTAILKKIRSLEASRDNGALTEAEFATAKARLLDTVEDAVTDAPPARRRRKPAPRTTSPEDIPPEDLPSRSMVHVLIACAVALGSVGLFVFLLAGDGLLAVTFVVTLLAALAVRWLQMLDE